MRINDNGVITEVILTQEEAKKEEENIKLLGKLIEEGKLEF